KGLLDTLEELSQVSLRRIVGATTPEKLRRLTPAVRLPGVDQVPNQGKTSLRDVNSDMTFVVSNLESGFSEKIHSKHGAPLPVGRMHNPTGFVVAHHR